MWMMRTWTRKVRAVAGQALHKKALILPCRYSDSCRRPHSWAKQSESGSKGDGSHGELSASQDSGGEGKSEVGPLPAPPFPPLHKQESSTESPGVARQAAPGKAMSTVGDIPSTDSQDAVIFHVMEDELKRLD